MPTQVVVDVARRVVIDVLDAANDPVVGLVAANFNILVTANGVSRDDVIVTLVEIDAADNPGQYLITFTPDAVGSWVVLARHALYEPGGFRMDYDVVTDITPPEGSGIPVNPKITGHVASSAEVAVNVVGNPSYTYRVTLRDAAGALEDTEDVVGGYKTVRITPTSSGSKTVRMVGIDGGGNEITTAATLSLVVPA